MNDIHGLLLSFLGGFMASVKKILFSVINFLSLKFLKKKVGALKPSDRVIYIDNKMPFFYRQIECFFENGIFDKGNTVIIAKFYFENYFYLNKWATEMGVKVFFYLYQRHMPVLEGCIIYYPYNSQSNCRMMLNSNNFHVFVTHGESNKKASVNRMIRMYDNILVSGDFSIERYVKYGILNDVDIKSGKIIRVGKKVAPIWDKNNCESLDDALLYMPTWEGGGETENYSSLVLSDLLNIIKITASNFNIKTIIIKPHPNTGARIKKYKLILSELVINLRILGYRVIFLDAVDGNFKKSLSCFHVKIGVVDISAAEFILAANEIPSIVLMKSDKKIYAPDSYLKMREKCMYFSDSKQDFEIFLKIYMSEMQSLNKAFFDSAFVSEDGISDVSELVCIDK